MSPISGKAVPLSEVPDAVFSEKLLGDGCAVIPDNGRLYSPVNGTVSTVADTSHAVGFTSDEGFEVLVHFGLNTSSLDGKGFTLFVKKGDRVEIGAPVLEADTKLMCQKGINTLIPVIVCNTDDSYEIIPTRGRVKIGKQLIFVRNTKPQCDERAPAGTEDVKISHPKKKAESAQSVFNPNSDTDGIF